MDGLVTNLLSSECQSGGFHRFNSFIYKLSKILFRKKLSCSEFNRSSFTRKNYNLIFDSIEKVRVNCIMNILNSFECDL